MKKTLVILFMFSFILCITNLFADWDEGDDHKMHYPQLPDSFGWDVLATHPKVLADDWQCTETGWIWDIHFWGSWKGDQFGTITRFHLSVHKNIPEDPPYPSMPGDLIWEWDFLQGQWEERYYGEGAQGWYNPNTGFFEENEHQMFFQYNFFLPIDLRIPQEQGEIYWLDVSAHTTLLDSTEGRYWGWKTSRSDQFMDDAVWSDFPESFWEELYYPPNFTESMDLAFVINGYETLPVELSTFTAQFINNSPTLNWVTQSETDNSGWYVYRNGDDNFEDAEKISGLIPGHGTTSVPHSYVYKDKIEDLVPNDVYYYWLESVDYSGCSQFSHCINITIPEIEDQQEFEPPIVYDLKNTPNPVKNSTTINFTLSKAAIVEIAVYTVDGRLVQNLDRIVSEPDQEMSVYWNGKDENNIPVANGIYLYKVVVDGKTYRTNKIIMIK